MKTKLLIAGIALGTLGFSAAAVHADNSAQAPTELVYLSQLPSAASLVKTAAAEGLTVMKIDQVNGETIVTYKYPDGRINTVSYQLLPAGEAGATATAPSAVPVPTAAPTTAVVYQSASPDVYYAPYPYSYGPAYYPWGWYAPVGVSLGFGFGHGFYRGGFHGGHWRR